MYMTRGQGQWPRVTGKNGFRNVAFIMKKSVVAPLASSSMMSAMISKSHSFEMPLKHFWPCDIDLWPMTITYILHYLLFPYTWPPCQKSSPSICLFTVTDRHYNIGEFMHHPLSVPREPRAHIVTPLVTYERHLGHHFSKVCLKNTCKPNFFATFCKLV